MTTTLSPGKRFRTALTEERPLQVVGTVNAYLEETPVQEFLLAFAC